jgi:non-ribosomal peptide synthetase component E (peptide arylation enzyme)
MFHPGIKLTQVELLAYLDQAGLSKFDMPEYFLFLNKIPLTPNGKIRKRDIVQWIAEGRVTLEPVLRQPKQATV